MKITKFSNRILKGMLLLSLFLIGGGCTQNFEELNTPSDKLVADNISPALLGKAFAQAQYMGTCGGRSTFQVFQSLYTDMYAQYFSVSHPNFTSDQFVAVGSWISSDWSGFYSSAATPLFFIEQKTEENSLIIENAIVKVWKVEMYHRITDVWGPIVYSQFGNQKTSVGYDSQEDIYNNFFKILDEAVDVLKQKPDGKAFAKDDLVFGGDIRKWIVFANSLRLRLAIRISYVNPALAKKEAEKAINAFGGVMTDNSSNAGVLSTINNLNGYAHITYINEFVMSATPQSLLEGYNDPRLEVYYAVAKTSGEYRGMRNGVPVAIRANRAKVTADYSFINQTWLPLNKGGTNPPSRIMSAAEVYFLRAEGALRGWDMGGTADELYNMGITKSLQERVSASPGEIESYINSTNLPVALNDQWNSPAVANIPVLYQTNADFETRLEQIITQKWIAIYPDSFEAWAERRRTGYPVGYPIIQSLNPDIAEGQLVRRLTFSSGEISSNSAAVVEATKLLNGPDALQTKLWWDAK